MSAGGRARARGGGLPVLILRVGAKAYLPEARAGLRARLALLPLQAPPLSTLQSCLAVWLLPAGRAQEAAGQRTAVVPDGAEEGTAAGQSWALGERYFLSLGASSAEDPASPELLILQLQRKAASE